MNNPKKRHPDVEKFCNNPDCRKPIERKYFGERIEDYTVYLNRKYCDKNCYHHVRQTSRRITPPKPKVKKKVKQQRKMKPTPNQVDIIQVTTDYVDLLPPVQKGSAPFIGPDEEPTPEEYLLKVMRDPSLSAGRRDQAAKILVTAKAKASSTPKTKKEERAEAASKVTTGGRFAPTAPPKIVGRIG
jgi:hypothetical protein